MPINQDLLLLSAIAAVVAIALRRRRSWMLAWLVANGVALLFLLPSLWRPETVPGATQWIGQFAPWQNAVEYDGRHSAWRDVPAFIEPWLVHMRREWRAGHLPEWNPYQGGGSPFWANGQSAPLFPLHLLFVLLPLSTGLVFLPWARIVIAVLGGFRLGRSYELSGGSAMLTGVAFALGGRMTSFLLFPNGNALALVPWVFWAAERTSRKPRNWPLLAGLGGLQALAGHPESVVYTALGSGFLLGFRLWQKRRGATGNDPVVWRPALAWTGGWLLAAGLAAAHLLPLAALLRESARWQMPAGAPLSWAAIRSLVPLNFFPWGYGSPAAVDWSGPFNAVATGLFMGSLVWPLALVALLLAARLPAARRCGPSGWAWLGLGSVVVGYGLPGVQQLHSALPVLGRSVSHYVLLNQQLALAVLAGVGLETVVRVCRTDHPGAEGGAIFDATVRARRIAVALCFLLWVGGGVALSLSWSGQSRWSEQVPFLLIAVAGWAWLLVVPKLRSPIEWGTVGQAVVLLFLVVELVSAHSVKVGQTPMKQWFPVTGAIELLQGGEGKALATGGNLVPNAATVLGIEDLRLDDAVKLNLYQAVYGKLSDTHATSFTRVRRWPKGFLDAWAVSLVLGSPGAVSPQPGWIEVYSAADATVWRRPTAKPRARWSNGDVVEVLYRRPGHWRLRVGSRADGRGPGILELAELPAPGWRARVDGKAVAVGSNANTGVMTVKVPAGSRVVELDYHAPGLRFGLSLSAASLILLLWSLSRRRFRD